MIMEDVGNTQVDEQVVIEAAQVSSFINNWMTKVLPPIIKMRALVRVDDTADSLERQGVIAKDETFIGTKVIAVNINQELPRVFTFLTDSQKFLVFSGGQDETLTTAFEDWYALAGRQGSWIIPILSTYYSGAMHGKSWVEIIADASDPLGTKVEYVTAENFIFPEGIVDVQMSGLLARRFQIPVSYLKAFGAKLNFSKEKMDEICGKHTGSQYWEDTIDIFKIFYRNAEAVVVCRWFSLETNAFLSDEVFHVSGAFGDDGNAVPCQRYPFVNFRYAISADQAISTWQGRGDFDESSQEAVQGLFTAYVNGANRASGFYPFLDEANQEGNRTFEQLDGLQHNKVTSRKLSKLDIRYPDPTMLSAIQQIRAQNANDAGHTDFATTSKRVANTTATEIAASEKQAALMSTIGVSMVALLMFDIESYRFEIFKTNRAKTKKLPPQFAAIIMTLNPLSVVDRLFRSRDEKLAKAKEWFAEIKNTPAAIPFMLNMLKRDLPDMYNVVVSNMTDTKPIARAMIKILETIAHVHPEYTQDPNFQKVYAAATQAFGGPAQGNAGGSPQGMAPQPNNATDAQDPQGQA